MKYEIEDTGRRTYRQGARAQAAEATGERILGAFIARIAQLWLEEITLEMIARDADVTVQTVVRRFGGKDGLVEAAGDRLGTEIKGRRQVAPGDVEGAVEALLHDYETVGDLVLRLLAQEERYPALKKLSNIGRAGHRAWIGDVFAPWREGLPQTERTARLDALVVATDVYVWKLVRRDMARSTDAYRTIVRTMIRAALGGADGKHKPRGNGR